MRVSVVQIRICEIRMLEFGIPYISVTQVHIREIRMLEFRIPQLSVTQVHICESCISKVDAV